MKVATIAMGIGLSAFLMTGCGGSPTNVDPTQVTPTATKPTAKTADLKKKSGQLENGGEFKNNVDTSAKLITNGQHFFKHGLFKRAKLSGLSAKKVGDMVLDLASSGHNSCVDKSKYKENRTEDNATHSASGTAKGTIQFTDCKYVDGYTLTATLVVDTQWNGKKSDKGWSHNATRKFDLKNVTLKDSEDNTLVLDLLKSFNRTASSGTEDSFSSDTNASFGIQMLTITDAGKKLLLKLDGINAKMTNKYSYKDGNDSSSYTASISGYIGDADGMYKISTPTTVSGDNTKPCPAKGEIVIEGSDGKVSLKANNGKPTLNDKPLKACDKAQ